MTFAQILWNDLSKVPLQDAGTILLLLITVFVTNWQIRSSRQVARGQIILEIDSRFEKYIKIHKNFRPGGEWYRLQNIMASKIVQSKISAENDYWENLLSLCDLLEIKTKIKA